MERENSHYTAIFKSEGLGTLATASQGFRSEEAAWTPSVPHSRPQISAKSQTALGCSLTTPKKSPPLLRPVQRPPGAQPKLRADHYLSKRKVLVNIWGHLRASGRKAIFTFPPMHSHPYKQVGIQACS